ncbi:hypothetical protein QW131_18805 [Roseibium salinum]|nr:hypothetical protein [Roseibium salinum]
MSTLRPDREEVRHVGKDVQRDQGGSGQKVLEPDLLRRVQGAGKVLAFQVIEAGLLGELIRRHHGNRKGAPQGLQHARLLGRGQRVVVAFQNAGGQLNPFRTGGGAGDKARRGGAEPPARAEPCGAFLDPVGLALRRDARRVVEALEHRLGEPVFLADLVFFQFHEVVGKGHASKPICS